MEGERQTLAGLLNPLWMFGCRPADFRGSGNSICPGPFWLNGLVTLLGLHVVSFSGCWYLRQFVGDWAILVLLPLGILWAWFVAADINFRFQGSTRYERANFDRAVINWFGLCTTLALYFVFLPVGLVALIAWWFS